MIDYDKLTIIIYFKTYKDTYSYEYIKNYLGFSYAQIDSYIDNMVEEEILEYNENFILQVAKNGKELLKEFNLDDIYFEDLLVDYQEMMIEEISDNKKLEINDIYIPKYFNEKFSGYGNKKLS